MPSNTINALSTITMTRVECVGLSKCHREYILKSSDVDKLQLISDAADGSNAFCLDTNELYVLHMGEWIKVGDGGE